MKDKIKINRKHIAITIAVLTAIAIVVFLIVMLQMSPGNDEIQYNIMRLNIFRLCIITLLTAAVGVVCIMLCLQIKLEYIFLTAALCLGTAYLFSITPMSAGDEPHHYFAAHTVSGYMVFKEDPLMVDTRYFDFERLSYHNNVPWAYLRLMDEGIYILQGEAEYRSSYLGETYTLDYPFWYFPQAIGVSIATLFYLSFFGVFYFGRFFNLLFYVLCVTLAIKRLNVFKLPIFLIGLMPMIMAQASSFSHESFIYGVSILFVAYVVSCIYERDEFCIRDFVMLLVLGMLLAPAKIVYLPIVFLVLVVAWKWRETIKGKAWILAGVIIVASMAMIASFMGLNTMEIAGDQQVNWDDGYNNTLISIFRDPFGTLILYLRTLYHLRDFLFYSTFGQWLSGLTIILPRWYIQVTIVLILAGVLYGKKDDWQPSAWERVIYLAICGAVVFLNITAMYLGWSNETHEVVLGLQGRYFIPILPLALLALKNKFTQISKLFYQNTVIIAFMVIQCLVVIYILNFTINFYG